MYLPRRYIIILTLLVNSNCNILGLLRKPKIHSTHFITNFTDEEKAEMVNRFTGCGCIIGNPKAYYSRIAIDLIAWHFRFSKISKNKDETKERIKYWGTEVGIGLLKKSKKGKINYLEINYNLLSALLRIPAFCTTVAVAERPLILNIIIFLIGSLFFFTNLFIFNFSILNNTLRIHVIEILGIFRVILMNAILIDEKCFNCIVSDPEHQDLTHYSFGICTNNLPTTYILADDYHNDRRKIYSAILTGLLPHISINI